MKSKSEKYRELLEEEVCLRNQLGGCETAQYRMLKKAFKGLGLKFGSLLEMIHDQLVITIIETTGDHVRYFRKTGDLIESYEISTEDLFDAEVK